MTPYFWWGFAGWAFAMAGWWYALHERDERRWWQRRARSWQDAATPSVAPMTTSAIQIEADAIAKRVWRQS